MHVGVNIDTIDAYQGVLAEAENAREKILVLEDDVTFQPFWTNILNRCCPNAKIDWVQTEEAAERLIRHQQNSGSSYTLVIADIFLSGKKTGMDLWSRFGQSIDNFIFVSSLSREKFDRLVEGEGRSYPVYLQKPLKASVCTDVVRQLIGPK